jgi:hypothetical protein
VLWRGAALADLSHEPFAQAEIARFEDLRAAVIEDRKHFPGWPARGGAHLAPTPRQGDPHTTGPGGRARPPITAPVIPRASPVWLVPE